MERLSNISFGAKFIKFVPVKKYTNSAYIDKNVSFVEADLSSARDVLALDGIAREFGNDSYADNIALSAKNVYRNHCNNSEGIKVFALTTQNDSFEKICQDKVLGLAQTSFDGKNSITINHLQVNPRFIFTIAKPEYKGIGSAILGCLKNFSEKISLKSAYNVKSFYKKNDFKEISPENRLFIWTKP